MAKQPRQTTVDLTIIIPVYNALPYFYKCIESITGQDLGQYSLEVILVDDGSTDGSGEYCDEAANQWSYIRTIHIENSGTPARPRNIGIEEASGNYIFFCDADDYFEEDALAAMLDHAFEDECDVGLFKMVGEDRDVPIVFKDDRIWKNCTVDNYKKTNPYFLKTYGSLKLYKHNLIAMHGITFPENITYEDLPFTLECYFNARNICIYNDRVYYHAVARDNNTSITQEKTSSEIWKNAESLLLGIENYLSVASQYCSPDDHPMVYRRASVEPVGRILSKLDNEEEEYQREILARMRKHLQICYSSKPLKQILGLRELIFLDALFLCDDKTYMEIFNSWPDNLSISFPASPDGSFCYMVCSDKDNHVLCQAPLPLNLEQEDQPIQKPSFLKNRLTHFQTSQEEIELSGHAQIIRRCKKGEIIAKLRINFRDGQNGKYNRWIDVKLENYSSICVYGSVYQIEFNWNTHFSFENLIPEDETEKVRIYFYLDIEFDTGETLSNRLGHNRVDGVVPNFLSKAVWYNDHLFAPYETSYKNLCFYAYLNAQPVKTAEIRFSKQNGERYLEAQGALIFDNYTSTQIELVVLDRDSKDILYLPIEKGKDASDRKFKGLFKLEDFDKELRKEMYGFEFKITVSNKTFRCQVNDIKAKPAIENQLTKLQITNDKIKMAGHVKLICRTEQGDFTTNLRLHFHDGNYNRWLESVETRNMSTENICGTIYQTEFDWNSCCSYKDLIPTDTIDPSRIYFFLDVEFGNGEVVSNRFGHNRLEGIYSTYISRAIWYENYLFAPYETKYGNFSLNVYSNVQLIKTSSLGFIKQNDQWYLKVAGALNFDNYTSTKIELVVTDADDKEALSLPLEKGESVKNRAFWGTFKLDELDNALCKGRYKFELRVAVTNKKFCRQDFEINHNAKNSIKRNGKQDFLYATNENVLYFATRQ